MPMNAVPNIRVYIHIYIYIHTHRLWGVWMFLRLCDFQQLTRAKSLTGANTCRLKYPELFNLSDNNIKELLNVDDQEYIYI